VFALGDETSPGDSVRPELPTRKGKQSADTRFSLAKGEDEKGELEKFWDQYKAGIIFGGAALLLIVASRRR
jgi:hypothetical protein